MLKEIFLRVLLFVAFLFHGTSDMVCWFYLFFHSFIDLLKIRDLPFQLTDWTCFIFIFLNSLKRNWTIFSCRVQERRKHFTFNGLVSSSHCLLTTRILQLNHDYYETEAHSSMTTIKLNMWILFKRKIV
jgi:hypothetical protein